MKKCLAIIPARGQSKRIPRKNVKCFCGQPIIKYSIDAAIKANCFEEIMVSTDDRQIAEIAESYGAKIPFLRSSKTASDYAGLGEVIEEVLLFYKELRREYDFFCCILSTAPFISPEKIIKAFNFLIQSEADSVIPVVRFSYPIQRALQIEDGKLKMIRPENMEKRSQDLMPIYHDCGQFYWMKVYSFLKEKNIFTKNSIPFILSEQEAHDIDTIEDWKIAEIKYKALNNLL